MKFHPTAIDRLLKVYDVYGGYREDTKLRKALAVLDISVYERQKDGQSVLVMTEELDQAKQQQGR